MNWNIFLACVAIGLGILSVLLAILIPTWIERKRKQKEEFSVFRGFLLVVVDLTIALTAEKPFTNTALKASGLRKPTQKISSIVAKAVFYSKLLLIQDYVEKNKTLKKLKKTQHLINDFKKYVGCVWKQDNTTFVIDTLAPLIKTLKGLACYNKTRKKLDIMYKECLSKSNTNKNP